MWSLLHEIRQSRLTQEAIVRKQQENAVDRAEARKVYARAVFHERIRTSGNEATGRLTSVDVRVSNFGIGPVRLVSVELHPSNAEPLLLTPIDLIPPGAGEDAGMRFQGIGVDRPDIYFATGLRLEVRFFDVNGRQWLRTSNGEPEEVAEVSPLIRSLM